MDASSAGLDVAQAAVDRAAARIGDRLRAAYVIGSLAHGGFSALVSDVDVAVVLEDPLHPGDGDVIAELVRDAAAGDDPLGRRLSVFWGSLGTVNGREPGGRFPPLDRLDLALHGRLLAGRDVRPIESLPTADALVRGAAEFALDVLATPARTAAIRDAVATAAAGPRPASKVALFPVRFLHTLRTGGLARNEEAAAHFLAVRAAPTAGRSRRRRDQVAAGVGRPRCCRGGTAALGCAGALPRVRVRERAGAGENR